jgi:hypothetical protein
MVTAVTKIATMGALNPRRCPLAAILNVKPPGHTLNIGYSRFALLNFRSRVDTDVLQEAAEPSLLLDDIEDSAEDSASESDSVSSESDSVLEFVSDCSGGTTLRTIERSECSLRSSLIDGFLSINERNCSSGNLDSAASN